MIFCFTGRDRDEEKVTSWLAATAELLSSQRVNLSIRGVCYSECFEYADLFTDVVTRDKY